MLLPNTEKKLSTSETILFIQWQYGAPHSHTQNWPAVAQIRFPTAAHPQKWILLPKQDPKHKKTKTLWAIYTGMEQTNTLTAVFQYTLFQVHIRKLRRHLHWHCYFIYICDIMDASGLRGSRAYKSVWAKLFLFILRWLCSWTPLLKAAAEKATHRYHRLRNNKASGFLCSGPVCQFKGRLGYNKASGFLCSGPVCQMKATPRNIAWPWWGSRQGVWKGLCCCVCVMSLEC